MRKHSDHTAGVGNSPAHCILKVKKGQFYTEHDCTQKSSSRYILTITAQVSVSLNAPRSVQNSVC